MEKSYITSQTFFSHLCVSIHYLLIYFTFSQTSITFFPSDSVQANR